LLRRQRSEGSQFLSPYLKKIHHLKGLAEWLKWYSICLASSGLSTIVHCFEGKDNLKYRRKWYKGLVCSIYKEHLQLNSKNLHNLKMGKGISPERRYR
jgi:hypothetical protein